MYKVFFNRKPIFLINEVITPSDESPLIFLKYSSRDNIVKAFKSKKVKKLYLYHPKEDKLWKNLYEKFPLIQAAGGLVTNNLGKILFIYRNKKWDLPKGKIEKKENIKDAAVREVIEETGIKNLKIIKPLPMTYHFFNGNGSYKFKKTFWYHMHSEFTVKLNPQIDEGILQAVWKEKKDLKILFQNSYENIKDLFSNI